MNRLDTKFSDAGPATPASVSLAPSDRPTSARATDARRNRAQKPFARYAVALSLIAATISGYLYWQKHGAQQAVTAPASSPAIPVTLGVAAAQDVPIYQRAVGTVQAFNTVAVSSRVDGQILSVDFTEGQDVKTGDLLFEIDPRPFKATLAQATAALHKDQAQLVSAKADLQRAATLLPEGVQTQQNYDQQNALVGQVQASTEADQAQIDAARLSLDYASVRSPISGRTGARLVDVGNMVRAATGTSLVAVTQLHPIFVSFAIPQQALTAIRQNQATAQLRVLAYSQDDRKELAEGTLTLIDNQVDPNTGTVRLKAAFANDDGALWPGEFVSARLVITVAKGAVTVPARAIQQGPNGYYLYVVRADYTVEMRPVTVAATEGDTTAITKGLAAGEHVVVDGQYRLSQGSRITSSEQSGVGSDTVR